MRNDPPSARAIEARKSRHLDICLDDDVASRLDAGFDGVRLRHEALPEIALEDVDTSRSFLGHHLAAPLLISSMTGGTQRAAAINRNLALAAERCGVGLALGSQRAALADSTLLPTYRVREVAADVVLFANLGAVQFNYGMTIDDARRAVADIGANGLYLHLNPLQEALQPRGDTNFRDLWPHIARLTRSLEVPVIVKSVGSGLSVDTARRLLEAGVAALDVAGAGGTSWARVEGRRANDDQHEALAETFGGWGYPTLEATVALRAAFPDATIVASGGVRSGVDVAKALALGADMAGAALPFLEPATRSADAVAALLDFFIRGFRIALFASGCRTVTDLPNALQRRGSLATESVAPST
ncbi:MAG: type 2 isopentenyl-diphosphate Delta-isomerase [Candidatus Eremiobacteraeota bacterium]|nr:type 2 isopentenyl-diphosphate Delta-isomerase [Candidatus Eremiobacteraeota bacterium]MBC5801838.1 type 2 isopentenyl-diphosphate Delta-isomerase [Candidatus Eremiobacteraeota bacterium]MBC5822096.1 type 2 isopentenyl-diphosphate Delta-isomerase [Candidatus Eremiobacteraeota bacterium]